MLAGDFNATFDHAEFRRLLGRGYRDAAEQAGVALRPTWRVGRTLPPTVAIDHVLADRRIRVVSARSVAIPGSDHRGVLADCCCRARAVPTGAAARLPLVLAFARREPSAILLAAQLAGVLLYPFMEGSDVGRALFSVFGIAILGLVVLAVRSTRGLTRVTLLLGVAGDGAAADPGRDPQRRPAALLVGASRRSSTSTRPAR